jgi:hypothetical protein
MLRPQTLAFLFAATLVASPVVAQEFSAAPANGTASVRQGAAFAQDFTVTTASSEDGIAENAAGCSGQYDLTRPEVNLRIEGPARPLRLYARSSEDTVLMVRSPSGEWLCNDDSDGTNPALSLEPATPGVYHVWVGPYFSSGEPVAVTLYADAGAATSLDVAAAPTAGAARLGSTWSPDPREIQVVIGTDVTVEECPGFYSAAPSFNLNYDGDGPLFVYARTAGDDDLTLAINKPDGTWECNDDAEGLNPGLRFDSPMAGLYSIWVGSFRSRARTEQAPSATLFLSPTTGPDPAAMMDDDIHIDPIDFAEGYSGGEDLMREAQPVAGTVTFSGGSASSLPVQAGGPAANSVMGMGCAGFLNPAQPTATVDFSGSGRLTVWADAEVDATLVVGLPDGGWVCNDDYEGLMPGVVIEDAAPGRYPVWVGTFMDGDSEPATLHVSGGEPFSE